MKLRPWRMLGVVLLAAGLLVFVTLIVLSCCGCAQPGAVTVSPRAVDVEAGAADVHVADGNALTRLVDAQFKAALAELSLSLSSQFQGSFDARLQGLQDLIVTSSKTTAVAASQPAATSQSAQAGRDARPVAVTAPISMVGDAWPLVLVAAILAAAYVASRWRDRAHALKLAGLAGSRAPFPTPLSSQEK